MLLISQGLSKLSDVVIILPAGSWSLTLSTIICSAIFNILPFGVKNFVMSLLRPSALVVFKGSVASVKIEEDILRLVQSVHDLVMFDGGAKTKQFVKNLIPQKEILSAATLSETEAAVHGGTMRPAVAFGSFEV